MAILDSSRIIDWSRAGVWYNAVTPSQPWNGTKGIPTYAVGNTVVGADATGAVDATSIIRAALTATPDYSACLVPAGTFYIAGNLSVTTPKVLRGTAGSNGEPLTTFVQHTSNAHGTVYIQGAMRANAFNWTGTDIVDGATKGSQQIIVSDASSFSVGQGIGIDQLNDSALVSLNGGTFCGRYSNGTRLFSESVIITAINGTTITIHRPLYYTYNMSLNPQAFVYSTSLVRNAGVEYIKFSYAGGLADGNGVEINNAAFCWIKNCEGVDTPHKHSMLRYQCIGCEVKHNYFHGATLVSGDRGYGTFIYHNSDDNLVEDNIYDDVHNACISESSCNGNVVSYNICPTTNYIPRTWMMEAFGPHAPHAYMNLYEGNVAAKMFSDYYFGSNSHLTWNRNYIPLRHEDATIQAQQEQAIQALEIMAWNRYENIIGNVIGHPTYTITYPAGTFTCSKEQTPAGSYPFYNQDHHPTGYMIGSPASAGDFDTATVTTMIRHGNFDYFSGATEWDETITDHDLLDSYYLSSKPNWFGSLDFPAIGPDVDGYVKNIPAQARWNNYNSSGNVADLFAEIPSGGGGIVLVVTDDTHSNVSDTISLGTGGVANFTLTAVPTSSSIVQRNTATYTITSTSTGGYNKNITLSASGVPAGCVAMFATNPIGPNGSSVFTINTSGMIDPTGIYVVTVLGDEVV